MPNHFYQKVRAKLAEINNAGLTKAEHLIVSRQGPKVAVRNPNGEVRDVINFCANNYLGLAGDTRIVEAASSAAREYGAGMSSVRFICGTQLLHKELEAAIARYLDYEDAILFPAAFDANGGLFDPLLDENDAIISDSLNHASIIDGVRLCRAKRYRFANGDMAALEDCLIRARSDGVETIVIATDGVFSMDGHIANLEAVVDLADKHHALVMVDDCHATGILGPAGRGSAAFRRVEGRIDFLSGTFGKALGGAMGGFVCSSKEVVALLRQLARPYLFSNAMAPPICAAALEAVRIAQSNEGDTLRGKLFANAVHFRKGMDKAGFELIPGEHPIVPVMLGDAKKSQAMAAELMQEGVYVTGFSFPVVPKGQARIRVQLSAAHSSEDVDMAVSAFIRVRDRLAGS